MGGSTQAAPGRRTGVADDTRGAASADVLGLVLLVPVLLVTTLGIAVAASILDDEHRDAYLGTGLVTLAGFGLVYPLGFLSAAAFVLGVAALGAGLTLHAVHVASEASRLALAAIYLSPLTVLVLQVFAPVVGIATVAGALGHRYARRRFIESA